jgi:diadenylate cyclase
LSCINYWFIRHLQATRGGGLLAGFLMVVIVAIAVFGVIVNEMNLPHLTWLANRGLPALTIGLLIIFQPELRFAISRLGNIRLVRSVERLFQDRPAFDVERVKNSIVGACRRMSKQRVGALIVLQRRGGIEGYASGGTRVNADLSASLIETIFHGKSPLHDGALFGSAGRVLSAGCHLPLSESLKLSPELGTRHRAALGLAEESDALVIAVSEERGHISVASDGELRQNISIEELENEILEGLERQLVAVTETKVEPSEPVVTADAPTVEGEAATPDEGGES